MGFVTVDVARGHALSLRHALSLTLVLVSVLVLPAPARADEPVAGGEGPPSGAWDVAPPWSVQEPAGRAQIEVLAYDAPVDAPVVRGFETPAGPYGPGHRGVDLRVAVGTTVRAAADGVVRHAGLVVDTVWVSIEHPDGIITSYGPIDDLQVRAGDRVVRGQPVGVVADAPHPGAAPGSLHFGARRDGAYFDPTGLLAPLRPALTGAGGWRGSAHVIEPYEPWAGSRWGGLALAPSPVAERPGFAVAPSSNHLVVLNGVGTHSDELMIDPSHLGYDPSSVTAFSYAGRHDDGGHDDDPWRDQLPYGPEDTWPGIPDAAKHLEAQLRAQYAREPGRAVDLVGHSMGGIIALYYLTYLHDPYDTTLPPIGKVVTIASPVRGSDLADTGRWLRAHDGLRPLLELVSWLPLSRPQRDRTPLDMPAIDQLATDSELLAQLALDWEAAVEAGGAGPLAMGTRLVTVGGSADLIATPGRTAHPTTSLPLGVADEAAPHVVAPGGHSAVTQTEAIRQIAWQALRGRQLDHASGTLTSRVADDAGTVMRLLGRIANVSGLTSARPPGP